MRPPRSLVAAILAVALMPLTASTGVGATVDLSLARFTDTAGASKTITTDTLNPPTSLAATGGSIVTLTWTATTDTYATGYELSRATVSGGPYTLVKTVAPRTTVSTTDSPGAAGTFFYVLQSVFQNWRSVNSNQASASVTGTTTGYHGCIAASNAADTGGDGNGYQTNANLACSTTDGDAVDTNSGTSTAIDCTDTGKDRHRWWDFNLGVPATVAAVSGVQLRTDASINNQAGTSWLCAQLSWTGGTSWTAAQSVELTSNGITTYTLGGAADTWGRTWAGSDFSNANFRVRIIDVSDRSGKDFRLDYLAVQVSYFP